MTTLVLLQQCCPRGQPRPLFLPPTHSNEAVWSRDRLSRDNQTSLSAGIVDKKPQEMAVFFRRTSACMLLFKEAPWRTTRKSCKDVPEGTVPLFRSQTPSHHHCLLFLYNTSKQACGKQTTSRVVQACFLISISPPAVAVAPLLSLVRFCSSKNAVQAHTIPTYHSTHTPCPPLVRSTVPPVCLPLAILVVAAVALYLAVLPVCKALLIELQTPPTKHSLFSCQAP